MTMFNKLVGYEVWPSREKGFFNVCELLTDGQLFARGSVKAVIQGFNLALEVAATLTRFNKLGGSDELRKNPVVPEVRE